MSLDRQQQMEDLIKRLWVRVEESNVLLQSALLELYAATHPPRMSAARFVADWHRRKEQKY